MQNKTPSDCPEWCISQHNELERFEGSIPHYAEWTGVSDLNDEETAMVRPYIAEDGNACTEIILQDSRGGDAMLRLTDLQVRQLVRIAQDASHAADLWKSLNG